MTGNHNHAGHSHAAHAPPDFGMAFAVGITLNLAFVLVEAGFGFWSGSIALIADAGHNFSDVLGLVIAWVGITLSKRPPSRRFTYGLKGSSILAALANAVLLLVAVGAILLEAVQRLIDPQPVAGVTVMAVAAVGILVNGITALLFARGRRDDINIRGAYLHMTADAAVSAAVVIAGALMLWSGALWIDPLASILVALVILWGSFALLRDSVLMSLAAAPIGLDLDQLEAALLGLAGVTRVHDLHVWHISTTETALTAHLVMPEAPANDRFLKDAADLVARRFHIHHATFQVETGHHGECGLEPNSVV